MRIGVLGAGAFGTALAVALAREGRPVVLWSRSAEAAGRIDQARENAAHLPGVALPAALRVSAALQDLRGSGAILLAVPAQATADLLSAVGADLPPCPIVLCAKGIERGTWCLQTEILEAALPGREAAVLTGPGFAGEIGRGLPTALTLAAADEAAGTALQAMLATPRLRLYRLTDTRGAQIGGALKNVVAIACGMAAGAGLGESARAALMTRGFAEMLRLALALGARAETLTGLSGLGDLALTCTSARSRNFALGQALGEGRAPDRATTEGVETARAACDLGRAQGVDLPIAAAVAQVLAGETGVDGAMEALLTRPLRAEGGV